MMFIMSLNAIKVNGIGLKESTRLAVLIGVQVAFIMANALLQPYRFDTVYYLEVGGIGLTSVISYFLLLTTLDSGHNVLSDGSGINAGAWIGLALCIIYLLILVRYLVLAFLRTHGAKVQAIAKQLPSVSL